MISIIIQTPTREIELVEDSVNGHPIYGFFRNGIMYVISKREFDSVIESARKEGFNIFDYRTF